MDQIELFQRLGVALAVGVLIGIERGWHEREEPEGMRVAGIRTFGIIGVLGAFWAMIAEMLGAVVLGFAFAAFAGVMIVARIRAARVTKDYGVTTVTASLLTFALGAIAMRGDIALAAAGGVITASLLSVKPITHKWIERLHYDELLAVLKLLVMSLVLLPVLPDKGYGPWQALNPYEMWLMVIFIAGISFAGYVAFRVAGARRGTLVSAFAGGLVASTIVTMTLSRLARRHASRTRLLAAGVVLAATTMFPRVIVVATVIEPMLFARIAWPLGLATVAGYGAAWLLWRRQDAEAEVETLELRNPFELGMALKFGALLAVIMLTARALEAWLGNPGIYLLAGASGVADVDAITLSMSRIAGETVSFSTAATAIVVAALSNTIVKTAIATFIGGAPMARLVAPSLGACIVGGAVGVVLT